MPRGKTEKGLIMQVNANNLCKGSFYVSHSSAIFYSLAVSCFAKRVNAYMPTCLLLFSRLDLGKEGSCCYLDMEGKVQQQGNRCHAPPPPSFTWIKAPLPPSLFPPPHATPLAPAPPPLRNPAATAMPAPDWSEVCIKAMTGHGHGTWGPHEGEATSPERELFSQT